MKELQCPICPRKLSTTYNLKHHLDTHSEKCNYCCHLCGKLFRTRSSLSNHIRVHLFDDAENLEGNKGFSGMIFGIKEELHVFSSKTKLTYIEPIYLLDYSSVRSVIKSSGRVGICLTILKCI
ncbi:hypothetical protein J437_LFUL017701, partial [Ladona fulva]